MMVENCRNLSSEESCAKRLSEIQSGMSLEKLVPQFDASKIGTDVKIEIISNPSQFISNYYCFVEFLNLQTSKDFEPDLFAYATNGFSFNKSEVQKYNKWLNSNKAKNCKLNLSKIKIKPTKIKSTHSKIIVLNPISFFEFGADEEFYIKALHTFNHERLHILFSTQKASNKIEKLWKELTAGEKDRFIAEHGSYNFKNNSILYREFFSYTFENDYDKALALLSGDLKFTSYQHLLTQLCSFCLRENTETVKTFTEISQLAPEKLLSYVEKDQVKVLILSSGRKNPSKLFNWGQVRVDPGQLSQISKIEGSMGKTICKGERPEAKDGITIILAEDSPYLTLVHEYMHVLQIRKDKSWCASSKLLWDLKEVPPSLQRMVRDREWDVRLILWNLLSSPQLTVEDRLLVADGTFNEINARKDFDPDAVTFLEKNDVKAKRLSLINEYFQFVKKANTK
jgi:hypothetical protein